MDIVFEIWQHVPALLRDGCYFLAFLGVGALVWMLVESWLTRREFSRFLAAFADVQALSRDRRRAGLSASQWDEIQARGSNLTGLAREWWARLDDCAERYTSPEGENGWFLTRAHGEVLPEETLRV